MHAILEGVSKSLLSAYIDSKNHKYRFYLGRVTKTIDERIRKIRPPPEFWKASEHRAWLLYYSLPVLSDLLPPDYIYHLSLLVSAMHILLGDSIPLGDVDKAHQQLQLFFKLVPQLYYPKMCGTNIHNLVHISQFVLNWGPLWSYSLFGFESMNGHLRKNCHGTGYIIIALTCRNYLRREKELPSPPNLENLFVSCLEGRKSPKSWKLRVGLHTHN